MTAREWFAQRYIGIHDTSPFFAMPDQGKPAPRWSDAKRHRPDAYVIEVTSTAKTAIVLDAACDAPCSAVAAFPV
jgi:hypothetical protein